MEDRKRPGAALPSFSRSAGQDRPEQQDAFYGLAHAQVNPVGLRVLFADGRVAFVQYHDIVSPLTFDGAGEIEVRTPAMSLKISGRNLATLFDHLCSQRVAWIKEPEGSFSLEKEIQVFNIYLEFLR